MKHVLAVLVDNKPGVLTRVSGLFSRRGFNIDSLAVGETLEPSVSRMTITVNGDASTLEQVVKQLNKLVNVIRISNVTEEPAVMRELMMIKVQADPQTRSDIQQIVETFRGKIIDVSLDSLVIEITGNEDKLEAIKILLQHFGIKELVRTGKVAILRGSKTTRENYGGVIPGK